MHQCQAYDGHLARADLLCLSAQNFKHGFKRRHAQSLALRARGNKLFQRIFRSERGLSYIRSRTLYNHILLELDGGEDGLVGGQDRAQQFRRGRGLVKGLAGLIVDEGRGGIDEIDRCVRKRTGTVINRRSREMKSSHTLRNVNDDRVQFDGRVDGLQHHRTLPAPSAATCSRSSDQSSSKGPNVGRHTEQYPI